MTIIVHKANERGFADHGWLKAAHSFSFAGYYREDRINFGALRVLNDDEVEAGMGFGTHPHENMEIITIPLEGMLQHKDSMGNGSVIQPGEIQYMRAGSGVRHSEYNPNASEKLRLLQIWIFPDKKNLHPDYNQLSFTTDQLHNKIHLLASPDGKSNSIHINQHAWISLSRPDQNSQLIYKMNNNSNGLYLFVIEGNISISDKRLSMRDAAGITNLSELNISANNPSYLLFLEVPMEF